jgi:hypothetical protein
VHLGPPYAMHTSTLYNLKKNIPIGELNKCLSM